MTSHGGFAEGVATWGGAGSLARVETFSGAPAPGTAAEASGGLPRRVHGALLRPVLYAGVERPVIALEATIAIGLVATVGPRLVTLVAVAVIVGLIHPIMAWVTSRDPLATAVYVRSVGWKDYYAPHAGVRVKGRVKPTLPRV